MHKSLRNLHESQPVPCWLHSAGYYRSDLGTGKPLHTHPVWEVVYYLHGYPRCQIHDDIFETQPGLLMALPPSAPHGEISTAPWACYWVLFEYAGLANQPIVLLDDREGSIRDIIERLIREWRSEQEYREAMIAHLLGQLGVTLQRTTTARAPTSAELLVQQFERELEDRFADPVSISTLCEKLGVSSSYMRAHFRRHRGVSPMQRIQQLRVRQAVASIRNSTQTLDAIAEHCGFSSASHLSRQVKRLTGKAPGAFRMAVDDR